MPLPTSASDVTETIRSSAQANGALAKANSAASGKPVKTTSSTVVFPRSSSAIGAAVKASAIARSIGIAPAGSGGSAPQAIITALTATKTIITASGNSYDLYTFLTAGSNTFVVGNLPITADIFLLGGGGGARSTYAGAGGQFTVVSNVTIPVGTYTVTVGAGGGGGMTVIVQYDSSNGGNSTMTIAGTTYTGTGGAKSAGNGAAGLTSDFTGVTTNYGGNGTGGAGGGGSRGLNFSDGGSGTNGLGGGGGASSDSSAWGGGGGSGRVMIRIKK
jgi:hypothetical protein